MIRREKINFSAKQKNKEEKKGDPKIGENKRE